MSEMLDPEREAERLKGGSMTDPAEIIGDCAGYDDIKLGNKWGAIVIQALTNANFAIADLSTHVIGSREVIDDAIYTIERLDRLVTRLNPDVWEGGGDPKEFIHEALDGLRAMINHKDNA